MKTSSNTLFVVAALAAVIALSVVLFNSRQAPQKAAVTKAEVKLPTEAMTKEWWDRAEKTQANAKAHWEHLTKLKEKSGFLAGDQMKEESKSLAEVTSEVEKAAERLKQMKKALDTYKPISTSIDFTTLEKKSQRIPIGATDPDKLWRSQMENARAAMRAAAIPMH